jgi:hypothetical protein
MGAEGGGGALKLSASYMPLYHERACACNAQRNVRVRWFVPP